MILSGTIEIFGMNLSATVKVSRDTPLDKNNAPRAYKTAKGKWRAFKTVDGRQKAYGTHDTKALALAATIDGVGEVLHRQPTTIKAYRQPNGKYRAVRIINGARRSFGSYDTRDEALQAARDQHRAPRSPGIDGIGVYQRAAPGESGLWRVLLTIGGKRVGLGEYATYGHAVLVRDVVARRTGKTVVVPDYEMPLWMISNAVARSYVRDIIPPIVDSDRIEYERRVTDLNAKIML